MASRLLFLATASSVDGAKFIKSLVEGKIIELISTKLDVLLSAILAGTKYSKVHTGGAWGYIGADVPHPQTPPILLPVPAAAEGHGSGPAPHAAARPR